MVDIHKWIDIKKGKVYELDDNQLKQFFDKYIAKHGNEMEILGEEQYFKKIESLSAAEILAYLYS